MQLKALLHFYNAQFAFFGVVFYNLTFFTDVSQGFIPYHLSVLLLCLFVAFALWQIRSAILTDVDDVIGPSEAATEEQRKARHLVQSTLSLGDMAEWTLGWRWRYLTEIAFFLFVFLKMVGRLCAVRLAMESLPSSIPPLACFALFLVLLAALAMLPNYMWIAAVSIFGVLTGLFGVCRLANQIVTAEPHPMNSSKDFLMAFSLSSGQVGAIFLPIANAASDFPQILLSGAVAGSSLAAVCAIVIGVSLLVTALKRPLPMVLKMTGTLPEQVILLLTESAIFPLLVVPCAEMFERRLLTMCRPVQLQTLSFDDLQTTRPLFERLRRRDSRLRARDIVRALDHKPPWFACWLFRLFLLAAAWALAIACWSSMNLVNALHFIQVAGVLFIAYMTPIFQFLVTQWSKIPIWIRVACFGIILLTILLTIPFYCVLIWQLVEN